jgi:ATP-dependent RNA helicase DDX49/DBP8
MEVEGEARPFLLFSKPSSRRTDPPPAQPQPPKPDPTPAVQPDDASSGDSGSDSDADPAPSLITEHGDSCAAAAASFADLGLSDWLVDVCSSLGMRRPTAVQRRCIPRALAGENVLGIAETGSGKTAAFALPILHRLGEGPFGVAALALSPTRELAAQLAEQFRALGSPLGIRCLAAIGGFDPLGQAKGLARRPHVVVATPGRIATLIKNDPDLAKVFARTKVAI